MDSLPVGSIQFWLTMTATFSPVIALWSGSPAPIGCSGGCLESNAATPRWSAPKLANSAGTTCPLSASGGLTQSRQL